MKKSMIVSGFIGCLVLLGGCSVVLKSEKGRMDLEYEVIDERDLPEKLRGMIEEQKAEPFAITYGDMESLYIAKGYGDKEESGYVIEIRECTENEDAIYMETILHGPGGEGILCESEYPFCVVKVGYTEKPVVFEE